jgi:7,8-dihydropterin-6-yl-methyl-4-(beta-D-ribofuranosyl)aminobenzene 5'-phosphate synthase
MSIDLSDGIDVGNLSIKILSTNEVSATLPTDPKFGGMVTQPTSTAFSFLAEHGLAAYIEVDDGSAKHAFLFDTCGMNASVMHNLPAMNIKWNRVEKLVISHGHFDHTGSLAKVIPELPAGCEVYLHPAAYLQNQVVVTKNGEEVPVEDFAKNLKDMKKAGVVIGDRKLPQMNKDLIEKVAAEQEVKLIETAQAEKLFPGVGTSGEIELLNPEELTPGFYLLKSKAEVEKHTFRDEIAVYFNVKGKGLVVLTGCAHSGIINIIRHGQKLTGIDDIYAVIGGFHLEMSPPEQVDRVIQEIEQFNPQVVCGMHCTGFLFNAKMLGHPAHAQGVTGTEFKL